MNPFRKRSKSTSAGEGKVRKTRGPAPPAAADLELSLPTANDFRTSLLLPKMADRFSLLRMEDNPAAEPRVFKDYDAESQHSGAHSQNLSTLEERDELDDELPVLPWDRRERNRMNDEAAARDNPSKDDFIKTRAQEGNASLFSSKQRTFKIRSDEGNCT
jgi:hypothetical protein